MFPLVVTATIVPIVTIGILLILLVTVFICLASTVTGREKQTNRDSVWREAIDL